MAARRSFRHALLQRTFPILAIFLIHAAVRAQTWRSSLYPENWQRPTESTSFYNDKLIQDFSYAGYKSGSQSLPAISGPIFNAVTSYGADPTGTTDSTIAIQSAITAAGNAEGGVVYLPAGTYKISPQGSNSYSLRMTKSNVVLRGAGASSTFLLNTATFMNNKSVIDVAPTSVSTGTAVSITSDLPGPTRHIPVASPGSFAPGDVVRLRWDLTDAWVVEHNQQTWWNATNGYPSAAEYVREVMAVSTLEGWIEVDVPTRYAMKTRDNPRVEKRTGYLSGIGIESLSIGNVQHPGTTWDENDYSVVGTAGYDVHNSWLIDLATIRDSWVTGVQSYQPPGNTTTCHMLSNGISLNRCSRVTLKDCVMGRPQYGGGGGNGYMYRLQYANDCLLQTCTSDMARHGFVVSHAGTSGNVFLQCNDRETGRALGSSSTPYTTSGSGSDNHMHFSHSNLWDVCTAYNSYFTAHHRGTSGTVPHGLTSAHGVYWNTSGSGTRYTDIVRSEQARHGYVIGTSGSKYGATNTTGGNTAPADHLEGIGQGATLVPASLYLDQLSRRLVPVLTLTGQSVRFPNNTFAIDAALTLDGVPVEEPFTLGWEIVSAPQDTRILATATAAGRAFTVSRPGSYAIKASGLFASQSFSRTVSIEVLPPVSTGESIDLLPVADSHVQGGPHPTDGTDARTTNFGSATTLQIKDSGAVHVHREAFMRFDLSEIPVQSIQDATLHLYFTSTNAEAAGRTSVVSDNTWGEMTINYLNRPTTQTALVGDWGVPAQDWLVINAEPVVPAQVDGDGLITFRQQITNQPSAPVYAIASRENANPSFRPFLRVHLAPPTLDEWLAQTTELAAHNRGPLEDPDGDGLNNLLEAWFGTDASERDAAVMPGFAMHGGQIELHMRVNAAPPGGLVYFIECSDTLAEDDWQLVPGVFWEPAGPEADGRIPMVARVPYDPSALRRFFRVNVNSQ